MAVFTTKANTLKVLEGAVKNAIILPQFSFTVYQWLIGKNNINNIWLNRPKWSYQKVIIRSSSINEDGSKESKAGQYLSVKNVIGDCNINEAIKKVIKSFEHESDQDQIFIQPMLQDVKISGVGFTKDPNSGSHYYIVNYDDHSGRSDTVTGGSVSYTHLTLPTRS